MTQALRGAVEGTSYRATLTTLYGTHVVTLTTEAYCINDVKEEMAVRVCGQDTGENGRLFI